MKKLFVMVFLSAFLMFGVIAPMISSAQEELESAGITPDSALWRIDKAFEQIQLAMAFGPNAKVKLGLEIAGERLSEIKVMINENKLDEAKEAKEEHGKALLKVKEKIEEIEDEDSEEEIKEVIEIESEVEDHEDDVEDVFGELKIKIKVEGKLTTEQQELIDALLASLQGQTGEIKIEIKNKKDETKIKIKRETGKSDEEIENEVEEIEDEEGIEDEEEKEAEEIEEDESDELEIEVEIENGQAEIKVELGKEEFKFVMNTVDREEIISEIMTRTSLSREEIDGIIDFEEEDAEDNENSEEDNSN